MARSPRAGGAMPDYLAVPEVSRFTSRRGKVHIEIGDAADGRQEPENARDYPPVPAAGAIPGRDLRTSAVSVGGLAGNNAHGAGFSKPCAAAARCPS